MRGAREAAGLHFFHVALRGGHDLRAELREVLHEFWLQARVHAQKIVADQHLAVARRAGTDADRRDRDGFGDALPELARDPLEHDRVRARFGDRARVGEHAFGVGLAFALHAEAAHGVHRLRQQADVTHDRDAGRRRSRARARQRPARPPT